MLLSMFFNDHYIMDTSIGAGGQIGAELTDFVLVLNTKEAVKTFSHFGSITLGTNISGKSKGREIERISSLTEGFSSGCRTYWKEC